MLLTQGAQAVLVTRGASTLFFDDFETASEVSPYAWAEQDADPTKRSDSDPDGASIGSWLVTESKNYDIQVINSAVSPDPGPYGSGYNYLRCVRNPQDDAARADFAEVTGGSLHLEFMAYIPSDSAESAMKIIIAGGDEWHGWDSEMRVAFMTRYDATWGNYIRYWTPSTSWAPVQGADGQGYNGAVIFTPDTWQKWEVDVDLDTQQWHLSVNNQTSFDRPFAYAGNTAKAVCFVPAGSPKTFYIDAVPEPATILLLGLGFGGLGLLRRR